MSFTGTYNAITFQGTHNRRGTFSLDGYQTRDMVDYAQEIEVFKAAIDATDDTAITCRNDDALRYMPTQLLCNLQANCLLAFNEIGIVACVAVVPAKGVACLNTHIKGIIIAALHGEDGCTTHEQLHDFGARRILRHEDIAGQTHRSRLYCQR